MTVRRATSSWPSPRIGWLAWRARCSKGYPGVARWEQTDDVAQNALIRLNRALHVLAPPSPRLLQPGRGPDPPRADRPGPTLPWPPGNRAHHSTQAGRASSAMAGRPSAPDSTYDPGRLAAWADFHDAVESLNEADRELFDLLWYQGLTQSEAAAILGISERTVHSRWLAARVRLSDALGGQLPV